MVCNWSAFEKCKSRETVCNSIRMHTSRELNRTVECEYCCSFVNSINYFMAFALVEIGKKPHEIQSESR